LGLLLQDPPHNEDWEYSFMIGVLIYLACNSRPDIAFAVHQCARFTHNPRHGHTQAVRQIVQYLLGTVDEGLVFETTKQTMVDCYVDADFCGWFDKHGDVQDPATA
jgi:hypothetical protein